MYLPCGPRRRRDHARRRFGMLARRFVPRSPDVRRPLFPFTAAFRLPYLGLGLSSFTSYQIGVLCKATNTPFYAVGESFKFVRLYPLSQSEMPPNRAKPLDGLPDGLNSISPRMDYT